MLVKCLTLVDLKLEATADYRIDPVSEANTEDQVYPFKSHSSIKYKAKSLLYTAHLTIKLPPLKFCIPKNFNKRNCIFFELILINVWSFLSCMLALAVCVPTKFNLIFVANISALYSTVKILYAVLCHWLTMSSKTVSSIKILVISLLLLYSFNYNK